MKTTQPAIVISATFTAEPIEQSLRFWARELSTPVAIRFAQYNQVFQELLDENSLLRSNRDGVNALLVRFEDWARFAQTQEPSVILQTIERNAGDFAAAVKAAAESSAVPFAVIFCPASDALSSDPESSVLL